MKNRITPIFAAVVLFAGATFGAYLGTSKAFSPESATAQTSDVPARSASYQQNDAALFAGSRHLAAVAKRFTPSVVHIQSTHRTNGRVVEETGSGVIIAQANVRGKFVVTNHHVVEGAATKDIDIHLYDGRVLHPLRVWNDPESDIALLQVSGPNLPAAEWGNSDQVEMGHFVLAVGSPFGLSRSMSIGIISAKSRRSLRLGKGSRRVLNQDFLQTDAAINPGNSGGPLIDLQGRVIGINTAIASNSGGNDGIGFSIPSNLVQRVMHELLTHGRVRRSYLGVKLDADFNETSAKRLRLNRLAGARVLEVYAQTPAAVAGLKRDDVVLRFNKVPVQDENHLINLVSLTPIGSTAELIIVRGGRTQTVRVKLEDREELVRRATSGR